MATTDITTDIGFVRFMLNDPNGDKFTDDAITAFMLQANGNRALPAAPNRLDLARLYWSIYLGWMKLASDAALASTKTHVGIVSTDTWTTYKSVYQLADLWRKRSLEAGAIDVEVPLFDTTSPYLDSTWPEAYDGLALLSPHSALKEVW